jgi:hypothetical protein
MPRKKKGESLEALTRAKIAETLPRAIEHALDSYHEYAFKNAFSDTKGFSAYHSACKAAAAHIELLLKLAQWAQLPRRGQDADLAALMQDAQDELNRYRDENDDS